MSTPLIVTTRDLIRTVANRWKIQYRNWKEPRKKEVGDKLAALDAETATPEDVAAIIGNESWTRIICSCCEEKIDTAVVVDLDDDGQFTACRKCVKLMHDMIKVPR